MHTIYIISNTINNKIYIGQTSKSAQVRFGEHKWGKRCPHLGRAIKKYGSENFNVEELIRCETREEADALEQQYIIKFDSIKNGYNIKPGGNTSSHNPETILKISLTKTGKANPHTKEWNDNIRKSLKGRKRPPEVMKKLKDYWAKRSPQIAEVNRLKKLAKKRMSRSKPPWLWDIIDLLKWEYKSKQYKLPFPIDDQTDMV